MPVGSAACFDVPPPRSAFRVSHLRSLRLLLSLPPAIRFRLLLYPTLSLVPRFHLPLSPSALDGDKDNHRYHARRTTASNRRQSSVSAHDVRQQMRTKTTIHRHRHIHRPPPPSLPTTTAIANCRHPSPLPSPSPLPNDAAIAIACCCCHRYCHVHRHWHFPTLLPSPPPSLTAAASGISCFLLRWWAMVAAVGDGDGDGGSGER